MLNFILFILLGIYLIYSTYICWWKPETLERFLANVYTDSWPTAKAIVSSKVVFWFIRIVTLLTLIAYLFSWAAGAWRLIGAS